MAPFSKSGMSRDDVFSRLEAFRQNDIKWQDGRVFGYIFDPGQAVQEIAKQAYSMFLSENGLDFSVFQSLLILEKELAAIGRRHLRGDADVVGNFTSGGTESILLAVKAAPRLPSVHPTGDNGAGNDSCPPRPMPPFTKPATIWMSTW